MFGTEQQCEQNMCPELLAFVGLDDVPLVSDPLCVRSVKSKYCCSFAVRYYKIPLLIPPVIRTAPISTSYNHHIVLTL